METITHREFRNNSGQVLERVRGGATIAVTNHGEITAILVPPATAELEVLRASGRLREPTSSGPIGPGKRVRHSMSSADVLADLRGDR